MELLQQQVNSNEQILKLVLQEDELSWQHIIYDLVRNQQMDPWDINLTELTHKFLEVTTKLTKLDFRIGGKIVLASALLLKIKSDRLMDEDLTFLDELIQSTEDPEDIDLLGFDAQEFYDAGTEKEAQPKIYPRTPQPRQRKVSVYDLVTALEQALEVSVRRTGRALDGLYTEVKVPEKKMDVSEAMNGLLQTIATHFNKKEELHFHELLPEKPSKQDTVYAYIPLLHLTNELRLTLEQPEHFGRINIHLINAEPVVYQTAEE